MEFKRVKCCSNCKFAEHDHDGCISCTNQNHPEPTEVDIDEDGVRTTFYPFTQHDLICEFYEVGLDPESEAWLNFDEGNLEPYDWGDINPDEIGEKIEW